MKRIFIIFLLGVFSTQIWAQHLNVKTNILYDATATINLGVEYKLGEKITLDIAGNYNNWTFSDNMKWKHWLVQPEFRYWICESFNGHFFGAHLLAGQFNFYKVNLPFELYPNLKDYNYQGNFYGGGIAYGYQWILSNRWSIEASLGVGYLYVDYDKYPCATCSKKLESTQTNYWGITKAGISVMYFIF